MASRSIMRAFSSRVKNWKLFLRAIHRRVRVLQKRLRIRAVIRKQRDTDAAAHVELTVLGDPGLRHHHEHALHDVAHEIRRSLPRDEHHEFVATKTRDSVAVANAGFEPVRHRAQQLVAHVMPEAVVDVLEAVEVDERHRDSCVVRAGLKQRLFETILQQ
jgi:hypothetical protein